MFTEYLKIAIKNLKTRPLRSWLTILGIIIGIFLITSLFSLSEGLKSAILEQLNMIGKNLIIVLPGEITDIVSSMLGGLEISNEEIDIMRKIDGVEIAIPVFFQTEIVRYEGESKPLIISGKDWRNAMDVYIHDVGWSIAEGRWPIPGKREVVVGNIVPKDAFKSLKLGHDIVIKGRSYEVVGIMKSVGQKTDDSIIHLDNEFFEQIAGKQTGTREVMVKVKEGYSVDAVAEKIKEELADVSKRIRGKESVPISAITSEKAGSIVSGVMGVVQTAIFGFAGVAIAVGGIGIMNTMYTSVRERTKEIGILKAVGAKNSNIVLIFLIESGIIGLVGGLGGILPGFGLAKIIESIAAMNTEFTLKASISPSIVVFSLVFSFLVGCLSGYLPARTAAMLKPVDALRRIE